MRGVRITRSARARAHKPGAAHRGNGRAATTGRLATVWNLASTILFVSLFVLFAFVHFAQWQRTGAPVGLGLVVEEGLVAVLFLLRGTARRTSSSPRDWLLAAGGSWIILAVRPAAHAVPGLGGAAVALQFIGVGGLVVSLGVLGRSFGVVAADRGLKTGGPYAVVRHPAYLCYLVTEIGYLMQNPTAWNLGVVVVVAACQLGRIHAEEAVLSTDTAYAAYAARVRYRLFPGIF